LVALCRWRVATGGRSGSAAVKPGLQQRRAQLVEGRLLDLADPLGAHVEGASELTQGARGPVQAEALPDDPPLARIEPAEQRQHLRGLDVRGHTVVGILGSGVGDEVGERAAAVGVAADRLLHRAGPALGGHQPLHLLAS
jgi:hypothetical protein